MNVLLNFPQILLSLRNCIGFVTLSLSNFPSVPGKVRNLTVPSSSADRDVTISWVAPIGGVESYRVMFDNGTRFDISTTNLSVTERLDRASSYLVSVVAIYRNRSGMVSSRTTIIGECYIMYFQTAP